MGFLITGGIRKENNWTQKDKDSQYNCAYLKIIDFESGEVKKEKFYVSPPERRGGPLEFTTGTLYNGEFVLPTGTEILFYDCQTLQIKRVISLPSFTDLHHVNIHNGLLYIANTGLEMVQVLSMDGEFLKEYNMTSTPTWERFDPRQDYRLVPTTQPHEVHVNQVFFLDDQPWATRCLQCDAICLVDPEKRIDLKVEGGNPHDGLVVGDYIYFTITAGFVIVVNKFTRKKEAIFDLSKMCDSPVQLGWCRGIEVVGDQIFVGFTRFRRSKFREFGTWITSGAKKFLPSRVSQFDLNQNKFVKEIEIDSITGGASIFTIKKLDPFTE